MAAAAAATVLTNDQQTLCCGSSCEVSDGLSGGDGDAHSAKRKRENETLEEEVVQDGIDGFKLGSKKLRTEEGCKDGEVDNATTA